MLEDFKLLQDAICINLNQEVKVIHKVSVQQTTLSRTE